MLRLPLFLSYTGKSIICSCMKCYAIKIYKY
nr:MAG TPA: hypothetical protein [Caudoviricetes sp.]